MVEFKKPLDFHLSCNCFLQVMKGARAQSHEIRGLSMFSDKQGNSGLALPIVKLIPLSKDFDVVGWVNFNFCPFCGSQIATVLARRVKDEQDMPKL